MSFDDEWDRQWGSIHEAGHVVIARHFGLRVSAATLFRVTIPHRAYGNADDKDSRQRLIVSAAGDVASTLICNYGSTGRIDDARSIERLEHLGASDCLIKRLMSDARAEARELVQQHRQTIMVIAAALRHRVLYREEINVLTDYVS